MSIDDVSGDRLIPRGFDTERWQHQLFAEIRTAPTYLAIRATLRKAWERSGHKGAPPETLRWDIYLEGELNPSAPYFVALLQAVRDLHLTKHGHPVGWAVLYLHDDVIGVFDPNPLPHAFAFDSTRQVDISVSARGSEVIAYREKHIIDHHVDSDGTQQSTYREDVVWSCQHPHEQQMMIGKREWGKLEAMAVEAARRAVADLRAEVSIDEGTDPFAMKSIKGGREADRELQVERLALRIMNRAGTRNDRRMDERWCDRLGIDGPR